MNHQKNPRVEKHERRGDGDRDLEGRKNPKSEFLGKLNAGSKDSIAPLQRRRN